jgi:SAM-dependent methyltransferase
MPRLVRKRSAFTSKHTSDVQGLYNRVCVSKLGQESRIQRERGLLYPLKSFHGYVKKVLIETLGTRGGRALDLCCGRGGFTVSKYVVGVDLSKESIQIAMTRSLSILPKYTFIGVLGDLGSMPPSRLVCRGELSQPYDEVKCLFALHYFEGQRLRNVLSMASVNLEVGGLFYGIVVNGDCVATNLELGGNLSNNEVFQIQSVSKDFESYTFTISDSVVEEGSVEYLLTEKKFRTACEGTGLEVITDWKNELPNLYNSLRLMCDVEKEGVFKPLTPGRRYSNSESQDGLTECSKLFSIFVCIKRLEGELKKEKLDLTVV